MEKELFSSNEKSFTVNITNSSIDSMREKNTVRKSVRVIDNGKMGISGSRSDMDFEKLEMRAKKLCSIEIPTGFNFPEGEKKQWNIIKHSFSNDDIVEIAESVLSSMNNAYPDFIFSNKVYYSQNNIQLRNSRGAEYSVNANELVLGLIYKHRESTSIMDGFWFNVYYDKPDIDEYVKRAEPFLRLHNNEVGLDRETIKVIFPDYTGAMPFRFLTKHINGELYQRGASYFSKKQGEKLFGEHFTLRDVNYMPEHGICSPFDGDGYMRAESELDIFTNGIFKNPLYDMKSAVMFNEQCTGTSSRAYNQSAAIGPNLLSVNSIDKTLKDIDEGVIAMVTSGGDFQDNGEISIPLQLAFLVKNGEIKGKLPQLMLRGHIDNLFNNDYIGALQDGLFEDDLRKYTVFRMNVKQG